MCLRVSSAIIAISASSNLPAQAVQDSTREKVREAQIAFFSTWRSSWLQSQAEHHALNIEPAQMSTRIARRGSANVDVVGNHRYTLPDYRVWTIRYPVTRHDNIACGEGGLNGQLADSAQVLIYGRGIAAGSGWSIRSRKTAFKVCPTWYLGPERHPPWDERKSLDDALAPSFVDRVRKSRASLITALDEALRSAPDDKWLRGQLVRMHVDQRSIPSADDAADGCATEQWYCKLLKGYVASTANDVVAAEALYRDALREMPPNTACALGGLGELLEAHMREWYETLACTQRDSLNRVAWWLADPLWIDPTNDRFVEHMTRRVLLELKRGASHDERFDWRDDAGSDARAELVMRYGWPAYVYWRGPRFDSLVSTNLRTGAPPSPPNAPYVSYEYGAGRVHVFPSGSAMRNPFNATTSAWSLRSPPGGDTAARVLLPDTTYDVRSIDRAARHRNNSVFMTNYWDVVRRRYVNETLWWPTEHYAASTPVIQLPAPEVAFLRRHSHAIIGTAFRFGSSGRRDSMIDGVTMVVTTAPDTMVFPVKTRAHVDSTVRLHAPIASQRALLGIEYAANNSSDAAGRTRFAIAPPPPLASMSSTERALSGIVLLSPANAEIPLASVDIVLKRMAPSPQFDRASGVGLYWESYGFKPSDSLTIEVRVNRLEAGGFGTSVRRFLGRSGGAQIGVNWRENPDAKRLVIETDGAVPIIGRTMQLRLDRLPRGEYQIEVIVRDQRGAIAQSQREIRIN